MCNDQIIHYKNIKRYPGGPSELGVIKTNLEIPGHQWPEFWKVISDRERMLLDRRKRYEKQIADIDKELSKL